MPFYASKMLILGPKADTVYSEIRFSQNPLFACLYLSGPKGHISSSSQQNMCPRVLMSPCTGGTGYKDNPATRQCFPRTKLSKAPSTGWTGWMAHRKWKESKQQPSKLPGPAVPGCCLISFHFLWAIHPIRPVYELHKRKCSYKGPSL